MVFLDVQLAGRQEKLYVITYFLHLMTNNISKISYNNIKDMNVQFVEKSTIFILWLQVQFNPIIDHKNANMYSASQVFFKRGKGMVTDVFLIVQFAGNQVTLYIIAELHSVQGVSDRGCWKIGLALIHILEVEQPYLNDEQSI